MHHFLWIRCTWRVGNLNPTSEWRTLSLTKLKLLLQWLKSQFLICYVEKLSQDTCYKLSTDHRFSFSQSPSTVLLVSTCHLVSGWNVPIRAVVGREPGGHIGVQKRGTVASGGFPVWTDPLLRGSAAQRLQDRSGGQRAPLWNTNGLYNTINTALHKFE